MLTFEEAKTVLHNGVDKTYRDLNGYNGFHVLHAWELSDSFVFAGLTDTNSPARAPAYWQVIKDEHAATFVLSPIFLPPYFLPVGKKKIDALLAAARRIL